MEENLLMENEAAEALRFAKDEAREAYAKDSEANAEAIDQVMESIVDGQGEWRSGDASYNSIIADHCRLFPWEH